MQKSKLQSKIKNYFKSFKFLIVVLSFALCVLSLTIPVSAAVLYLEPSSGQYQAGDTFIVDVKIDPEGECLNAVETGIIFPQDILKYVNFSKGNSILSLWIKEPTEISSGLVGFAGGIPNGYCGRIPGDPGPSDILGQIIFRIPGLTVKESDEEQSSAELKFLDNSQVLLNDGLGTPAKLTTQGATLKILSKAEPFKDEWQEKIKEDIIPPEPFKIIIQREPTMFKGKYFLIFQTTDKQTGLDYYQVKEGDREWTRAESPYLLKDQSLKSVIKVKAIDKAGNERIAEYQPVKKSIFYQIVNLIKLIWNWLKNIIH